MEIAQGVSAALQLFNDNFDLVHTAVSNITTATTPLGRLREERHQARRERALLKLIASLSPSDIPGYVAEIDGLSDAELQFLSHLNPRLARNAVMFLLQNDNVPSLVKATIVELRYEEKVWIDRAWKAAIEASDLGESGLDESGMLSHVASSHGDERRMRLVWDAGTGRSDLQELDGTYRVMYICTRKDALRRAKFVGCVLESTAREETIIAKDSVFQVEPWITKGARSIADIDMSGAKDVSCLKVVANMWNEIDPLLFPKHRQILLDHCLYAIQNVYGLADEVASGAFWNKDLIVKPSFADLKDASGKNKERTTERINRTFYVSDTAKERLSLSKVDVSIHAIAAFSDMNMSEAVSAVLSRYRQREVGDIATDQDKDSEAGIFASYIYASQGDTRVAEKYKKIFQARKICYRSSNSGTIVAVPFANRVMMTTYGMKGTNVEYVNCQAFEEARETRILFLPTMLMALGLTRNERIFKVMEREMENNPLMVTDPISQELLATMRSILSGKTIDTAVLSENITEALGDTAPVVIRETVSLIARIGAHVDPQTFSRSSFYDVTANLKNYSNGDIVLKFTKGVTLDGMVAYWLFNQEILYFPVKEGERSVVTARAEASRFVRQGEKALMDDDIKDARKALGLNDSLPQGYFTGVMHLDVKIGHFENGTLVRLRRVYAE